MPMKRMTIFRQTFPTLPHIAPKSFSRRYPLSALGPSTSIASQKRYFFNLPKELIAECRRHGSDYLWPRSLSDEKYRSGIDRITKMTLSTRMWPNHIVALTIGTICAPREMALKKWEGDDRMLEVMMRDDIFKDREALWFTASVLRQGCENMNMLGHRYYPAVRGVWKFRGELVSGIKVRGGYDTFLSMSQKQRPAGFGNGGLLGELTFLMVWTADGIMWLTLRNKKEFSVLRKFCSSEPDTEFVLLFMEHVVTVTEEQYWDTVLEKLIENGTKSDE